MEPTEPEVIKGAIVSWLADVHTSLPGKILKYDSAKQVADIQPAVQRSVARSDGGFQFTDYPVIPNVKVAWLASGGCSFQLPVQPGDACWLLFSEACWAQYRRTGQITAPGDLRRFDLSYPIAVPFSLTQAIRNVTSGPHLEVPSGKVFTVGGDPSGMNFVALANLVGNEFDRVQSDISTLKTQIIATCVQADIGAGVASAPPVTTTVTTALGSVPSSPNSVAAQAIKTQ